MCAISNGPNVPFTAATARVSSERTTEGAGEMTDGGNVHAEGGFDGTHGSSGPMSAETNRVGPKLTSAQAASAERVRFERRVVGAGATCGAMVVNIYNITLANRMDELMPLVAQRLAGLLRADDEISRIGLQQLAVVIDTRLDDVPAITQRIEESFEHESFWIGNEEFHLHALVSYACNDEAGAEGPLLLALDRNAVQVQERHRRILHEGTYNEGQGGGSAQSIDELAQMTVESVIDPAMWDGEAARYEFDDAVWEAGVIPERDAEFDIEIEVGQQIRGRVRAWKAGFSPPVAFLHSTRAYTNEACERLVALEASRTDDLTGLVNRAGLRRRLERQHVSAVALVDLDRFKSINDKFGYATGDKVLCLAASVLQDHCAPGIVARWGGEEFVAVTEHDAAWLAERLADALDECRQLSALTGPETVTFSAGVASVDGDDWAAVLPTVNEALHRAKADRATVLSV